MAKIAISPAASRPALGGHDRNSGFTLFELLIVLAIMAVLASFTGLAVIRAVQGNVLERTAAGLTQDLRRARRDAVQQGVDVQLEVTETGYRIWTDGDAQALMAWPADVEASLAFDEGQGWQRVSSVAIPQQGIPLFLFRLVLTQGDQRQTIQLDPISGEVRHDRND
ncbi:type II secretion system protein [Maricaulis parjimensis]|uniref:type II secretion system protein n=1 Tax=Maricaulis parjimensis TaxID=144023 RepID=UPI00193A55EB|nr:type II secretion system protein [Maricaulis parjimensis]